jgi:two-component system, NarL family, response regulator LiaR
MTEKIKIFIVDDHEIFRQGLAMVINNFDFAEVVGEAANGNEFLEKMMITDFDLVLMDINMPDLNGIETTIKAIELKPELRIAALTMFGDDHYLQSMLNAGAIGFLLKNIKKPELEMAIKMMAEGKNYFSGDMLQFFTKKITHSAGDMLNDLTKRELEILQLIAQGCTNQEISDKLFISVRTVEGHKANLLVKTNSKNIVVLVIHAIQAKLITLP